jgi:putative DNA methylase
MHRYFARRPYSVFNGLVEHYSNPGSIVLDPFCGGGVTIVEALRLRRKAVGVDLNPLATFITRNEVSNVNVKRLEELLSRIEEECENKIQQLYRTNCPKCGAKIHADWFEWSNVVRCKSCRQPVRLSDAPRVGKGNKVAGVSAGKFHCTHKGCDAEFRPSECERLGEELLSIHVECPKCKAKSDFKPSSADIKLAKKIAVEMEKTIEKEKLWYPKSEMPEWWELRRPYNAHIRSFSDWFTKRNLLANAILATEIRNIQTSEDLKSLLAFIFSASLRFTNRIVFRNPGWQGGKPIEWASSVYWVPEVFCEINVWKAWKNRQAAVKKGKEYSKREISSFCRFADAFSELKEEATCMILTGSSTHLPLPDSSVDAVITDPPYGNNVLYSELCNFYWIWISGILDKESMIDDTEEAITSTKHKKELAEYRSLLYMIFKDCHRVLKPNRWMVMTFHNRDFAVWNALHLAAHDAGFVLSEDDGMIYQQPIRHYVNTIQTRRTGSMLGDFILSFQKAEKRPRVKMLEEVEVGNKVRKLAAETIQYHGGAKLTMIYTRLVPFLLNNGLLHKFKENDITPFLRKDFVEKDGRWYFKENIDETGKLRPIEYVPVEARIEYLLRSLFYEKKRAAMDEILEAVFANLINGNVAEYEEISNVLARIAEKIDGRTWRLKEQGSEAQRPLSTFLEKSEEPKVTQITLTGQELITEESTHDLMIKLLAAAGTSEGFDVHIGQTEQRKYVEFRRLSTPMGDNIQYGLNKQAFDIIREIDVLWLKADTIVAAFEIEKSTTIDSGINRFRNLFAATPNQNIPAYIVIPDNREDEAVKKIGSLANRKEELHKKIRYIFFSRVKSKKTRIEDEAKEVV